MALMIEPTLLKALFDDSYEKIKEATAGIKHELSVQTPPLGGNCIHWILGHVVVARCNFLMMLDVPSVWDWPTCKLFIPGSSPSDESAGHISFSQLIIDFDRTQEQLQVALDGCQPSDLEVVKEDKSVGQHLAEYALHEAFHAGQLDLLRHAAED